MADDLRHRLRTPLNHIVGYSELLLDEAQERGLDDFANDLRKIRAAGHELLGVVDEIFEVGLGSPDSPIQGEDHAPGPSAPTGPSLGRLLVVDDNDNNLEIVTRFLEREAYTVAQARDGAEALAAVKANPPDLILLDVMMPVMDGIEACTRLKSDPETRLIPIVIMTALSQVDDRIRGIAAGADDFLTKPVNRTELLARIQTSLRLKQTVDQKIARLRGTQDYLARFVPLSVRRRLEENPDAPVVDRTDQDMTALFVDVTSYARLSESMRQTADVLLEKYFSRYLDVIHAHGGDVTETSGDGLMVVFPGADAQGHAVNAVRAALAILAKTEQLNVQLEGFFDPISLHMGVNSGIAAIGPTKYEGASGARWVYTALGPVVNLAARIAGVAEAGTIMVGPDTAARIEGSFAMKDVGKRQLKNVKDEVLIRQVLGAVTS